MASRLSGIGVSWSIVLSMLALTALVVLAVVPMTTLSSLPPICPWRTLLGLQCPGCGGTRAIAALLHGDVIEAFRHNALAPVVGTAIGATALGHVAGACRALLRQHS
jgi:hypothetical protein